MPVSDETIHMIVRHLAASGQVQVVYLRGSFARGTFDSYSDVDLVVVLRHSCVQAFADSCARVTTTIGSPLLSFALPDEFIADLGGAGIILYTQIEGTVVHLDLYMVPECTASALAVVPELCRCWGEDAVVDVPCAADCVQRLRRSFAIPVEAQKAGNALVCASVASKKARRGDVVGAAHYRSMTDESVAWLLRRLVAPGSERYGMLDWPRDMAISQSPLVAEFISLLRRRQTLSSHELLDEIRMVKRALRVVSNPYACELSRLADWIAEECVR